MSDFRAYRLYEDQGRSRGEIVRMKLADLDDGDIVIKTAFCGVNYKDALAGTGRAPIIRRFPCVGGIEAVGQVALSESADFKEGDRVIVHGRGLGVSHDGGLAEYLRVPSEWVVRLPAGLEMHEAAVLGVAGHTAAVAIDLLEHNGLRPTSGPVAVTGATGGAASLSIDMMAQTGYDVVAVSRKRTHERYLRSIGAVDVQLAPDPDDATRKPLGTAQWAGAIDAAGGYLLAWLLSGMKQNGPVACFGNAAGIELNTTVLPFILRGARLLGVNADTENSYRRHLWERLASDLKPRHLESIATYIGLEDLPRTMTNMVEGTTSGRYVVRFQ